MRARVVQALLPMVAFAFVAASASAQNPAVQISLSAPEDPTANGTAWAEPLTITFSISGLACATPATWDLGLEANAPEGGAATWEPTTLTMTVPAGQHMAAPYQEAGVSTLTVDNPNPNGTLPIMIVVSATSAGGNCVPPPAGNAEMLTTLGIQFPVGNVTTTPELAMPSPGLLPAVLAVGLALAAIVRRR